MIFASQQNNASVKVDRKFELEPYLFASKAVLHTGSTASLQAIALGRKTISYAGLVKGKIGKKIANELSINLTSLEEINSVLESNFPTSQNFEDLLAFVDERVSFMGSDESAILQTDELLKLSKELECNLKENQKDFKRNKFKASSGIFKRALKRATLGKSSQSRVHESKRPIISYEKVNLDFLELSKFLNLPLQFDIFEMGESTFKFTIIGNS